MREVHQFTDPLANWFFARLAIDSDAHTAEELDYLARFGIGVARRGWVTAANVVNTQSCDQLLAEIRQIRADKESS